MVTSKPWNIMRVVEEVGDAIYPYDPDLRIEVDSGYPLIYVFSRLPSLRVFKLVIAEPPAYAERVVPVTYLFKGKLRGCEEAAEAIVEMVSAHVRGWQIGFSVEARPRGYYIIGCGAKRLTNIVAGMLRGMGFSVSRRERGFVRIEDTYHGVVLSAVAEGSDRVSFWRARRLGAWVG